MINRLHDLSRSLWESQPTIGTEYSFKEILRMSSIRVGCMLYHIEKEYATKAKSAGLTTADLLINPKIKDNLLNTKYTVMN